MPFPPAFATASNEKYGFRDLAFTHEAGTENDWTSDPVKYWPDDGSELHFVAACPAATDWGGTYEGDKPGELKVSGFSPAADIAGQKDLLAGYASGNRNNAAKTEIELRHVLTQVEVRAKSSNNTYRYDVKAVRIGSVHGRLHVPISDKYRRQLDAGRGQLRLIRHRRTGRAGTAHA